MRLILYFVFFFQKGKDEFIGRSIVKPTVKLNGAEPPSPQLLWYEIEKGGEDGGELLAAFELFLVGGHVGNDYNYSTIT